MRRLSGPLERARDGLGVAQRLAHRHGQGGRVALIVVRLLLQFLDSKIHLLLDGRQTRPRLVLIYG